MELDNVHLYFLYVTAYRSATHVAAVDVWGDKSCLWCFIGFSAIHYGGETESSV